MSALVRSVGVIRGRAKKPGIRVSAVTLSAIEETLALHIRVNGIARPEREFRFHPDRQWRFDFAWPDKKIAVECEGGIWTRGRHTRGKGFEADCEKYNAAAQLGWTVLRFTDRMVNSGSAIVKIAEALDR